MSYQTLLSMAYCVLGVDLEEGLSEEQHWNHACTGALISEGFDLSSAFLGEQKHIFKGVKADRDDFSLTYRLINQTNLFCIEYLAKEIGKGKQGLVSPFKGFEWFLEFLAAPESGVERIVGLVKGAVRDETGMSTGRLVRVFRSHMDGVVVTEDWAGVLMYRDLK